MFHKVKFVAPLPDCRLSVQFIEGIRKIYDVKQLFNELGLDNYIGLEISTLKLFLANPDLMAEYNIQDEYELHNLMKKCEDKLPDIGITLGRMPFIAIGNADRAKQVEEFLFRVAPIEIYQFGAA